MDNVIIGKFLGSTILGFYSKAYQLMMMPLTKLRDPLVTVGTPALSSLLKDPERYQRYYHRLIFIICFFAFPMTVFMGIYAKELILIVLGPQWLPSVLIFQILSISSLIQPITGTTGLIFISAGKPNQFFKMGLISSITIVSSFIIGVRWGVYGVTVAYAIANYLLLIPVLIYCFKDTPIKFWTFINQLAAPAIHTIAFTCLILLLRFLLKPYLSNLSMLVISFLISVPFYYCSWLLYKNGKGKIQDINNLVNICYSKLKSLALVRRQ
jgi:PST family polysaccharide transporter